MIWSNEVNNLPHRKKAMLSIRATSKDSVIILQRIKIVPKFLYLENFLNCWKLLYMIGQSASNI